MSKFIKSLFPNKVLNFDDRINKTLGVFDKVVNSLKDINADIGQAIDNNDAEIEELNNQKVTLEAENFVFQDQAKANNAKINQITKFLNL